MLCANYGRCGSVVESTPSCSYALSANTSRRPATAPLFVSSTRQSTVKTGPPRAFSSFALDLIARQLPIRDYDAEFAFDIIGLGQAMVDFSGVVDDDFLEKKQLPKGGRRYFSHAV